MVWLTSTPWRRSACGEASQPCPPSLPAPACTSRPGTHPWPDTCSTRSGKMTRSRTGCGSPAAGSPPRAQQESKKVASGRSRSRERSRRRRSRPKGIARLALAGPTRACPPTAARPRSVGGCAHTLGSGHLVQHGPPGPHSLIAGLRTRDHRASGSGL